MTTSLLSHLPVATSDAGEILYQCYKNHYTYINPTCKGDIIVGLHAFWPKCLALRPQSMVNTVVGIQITTTLVEDFTLWPPTSGITTWRKVVNPLPVSRSYLWWGPHVFGTLCLALVGTTRVMNE